MIQVVMRNLHQIVQCFAMMPEDMLMENKILASDITTVKGRGSSDALIQAYLSEYRKCLVNLGKYNSTPELPWYVQACLGWYTIKNHSAGVLLFTILCSTEFEEYLPASFIDNILKEAGVGTSSLIQVCNLYSGAELPQGMFLFH